MPMIRELMTNRVYSTHARR